MKDETCSDHKHIFTYGYCLCGERDSTKEFWFEIFTAEDLFEFARIVNSGNKWLNAKLMNDIDMSEYSWFGGFRFGDFWGLGLRQHYAKGRNMGMFPIVSYSGVFDGQNNSIKGFCFWDRGPVYGPHGFINELINGTIKNIVFENFALFNHECTTSIVFEAENSTFYNCGVTGNFVSEYGDSAGLVLISKNCSFEKCYNAANLYGDFNVAGITIHYGGSLVMKKCWNVGSFHNVHNKGVRYAGLVNDTEKTWYGSKRVESSDSCCFITDCYNWGNANDGIYGGILLNQKQSDYYIENCYNIGKANEGVSSADPICLGYNFGNVHLKNCYYLKGCVSDSMFEPYDDSTSVRAMTAEQFASGEVCFKLNNGITDGTQSFNQNLIDPWVVPAPLMVDLYPMIGDGHRIVYTNGEIYYNYPPEDTSNQSIASSPSRPSIHVSDKTISVSNASGRILLLDISGRILFSKKISESGAYGNVEIPISGEGSYILCIDGTPYKLTARKK